MNSILSRTTRQEGVNLFPHSLARSREIDSTTPDSNDLLAPVFSEWVDSVTICNDPIMFAA